MIGAGSSPYQCSKDEAVGFRQLQRPADWRQPSDQLRCVISMSETVIQRPGLWRSRCASCAVEAGLHNAGQADLGPRLGCYVLGILRFQPVSRKITFLYIYSQLCYSCRQAKRTLSSHPLQQCYSHLMP